MCVIPWTLEIPVTIDGVLIGHLPDIDCHLLFDDEGTLTAVAVINTGVDIERDVKSANGRALWAAATAAVDGNRHLRLEIESRLASAEPYADNSAEAIRRELSPVFL